MALTVQNLSRGNYVLGGPGRLQGPSAAEAMDLAQREEQRFRDAQRRARQTELAMQETQQAMALRQSQEQRAQANFRAQQAARSQAANQDALRRRLLEQYGGAAVGTAPGLVTGAPGVGVRTPAAGATTGQAGLSLSGRAPAPLSLNVSGTGVSGRGLTVPAPTRPAPAITLPPNTTPAGVNVPAQRSFMTPESMQIRAGLAQAVTAPPLAYGDATARDMQRAQIQRQVDNLNAQIQAVEDAMVAAGEGANVAATTRVVQQLSAQRDELLGQMPVATSPAIARGVLAEEGPGVAAPPQVEVQTTAPNGEQTTVTVDEGPTVSPDAGLRDPASASPIDQILRQPVGSGAVASDIPRDLPRLSAAITQGFTERERLVEAYNAFSRAGLTEDAQGYLQAIQNLDQTLIRLQGEQAINDLQIGSVERAAQLLSYYYGAGVQPVLTAEGVYDLYVNGQPVENEDMLGLRPDQMGDLLRPFFDDEYRAAMAEGRERYLTTRAEEQARRDMAEDENPGFTRAFDLEGQAPGGGDLVVMRNEQGELRLVWFVESADGRLTTNYQALTQEELRTMLTPEQLEQLRSMGL